LLVKTERETCYGCHLEIRARFELPFKHRVNEGAIDCTDCHNPHGAPVATWRTAQSPQMVTHALGNDIACVKCHSDKRGPFVYEHAPVRVEGCTMCHNPHGSVNPRLLARPATFTLCLECHNNVMGFGTREEGVPAPSRSSHNLANPAFQNCLNCHVRIHGSNVDALFRR
jgi:DmsE family decaheme c-type cytochrome